MNFSLVHQRIRTEIWLSATFGLWALAATVHLIHNYGKDNDTLLVWIFEILTAAFFAMSFGWHLRKLVTLHRLEKRGKLHSFDEEF